MLVLVEDAVESVAPADAQAGAGVRRGHCLGQCAQWPGVGDAPVGPVAVVELLELAQGADQVPVLVENLAAGFDQGFPRRHDRRSCA